MNYIKRAILTFAKANQAFPKNIIVFRDGVSSGQVKAVETNEVSLLAPAF